MFPLFLYILPIVGVCVAIAFWLGRATESRRRELDASYKPSLWRKAVKDTKAMELFADGVEADLAANGIRGDANIYMAGRMHAFEEIEALAEDLRKGYAK